MSYSPGRRRRRRRGFPVKTVLFLLLILVLAVLFIACEQTDDTAGSPSPSASVSPSVSESPSASASSSPPPSQSPSPSSGPAESGDIPSESPTPSQPAESSGSSEIPWYLTLVNRSHPLPEDFEANTTALPNGLLFDSRAYDALMEMYNDCKAAGLEPLICSAYRTIEKQTELFERKINKYMDQGLSYDEAYETASTIVAIPGTSEHNLGLAVDICAVYYQVLDEGQESTPEQKWLMEHCHEYGFILRYPNDKTELTGIIYEPWHYRYVGVEAATEIMSRGICLEEYYELYYSDME